MAIQKTIEFPGGITVPVYMLITGFRRDRITGQVSYTCAGYVGKERRDAASRLFAEIGLRELAARDAQAALNEVFGRPPSREELAVAEEAVAAGEIGGIETDPKQLALDQARTRTVQAGKAWQALAKQAQVPAMAPVWQSGEVVLTMAQSASVTVDGAVDLAKLYELAKAEGGPLAGGEDC